MAIADPELAMSPRYFGYDASMPPTAAPWELPEAGLVCMVFRVGELEHHNLHAMGETAFKEGHWAVSTGAHEDTVVHGPFDTLDSAFEFGRVSAGAVRFRSDAELE